MGFFFRKEEKRRHPRIKLFDLVKCEYPPRPLIVQINNLVNLSEGGLQFLCQDMFKLSQEIRITINLAELERDISVRGKVVWIRKERALHNASCRVGISFTEISDPDRRTIHEMAENLA
ncbi:MAG: PilZ domain-containing protein [Candidatus Omnitrophica bacterium]|nr:PilZ domain-containing protein [Candidatus Omnitrophota bacterium]